MMINTPQDDLLNEKNKEPIASMSEKKIQEDKSVLQNFANEKEIVNGEQERIADELGKKLNGLPVENVDNFYTGEVRLHEGKEYHILDTNKLVNFFGEEENATFGKKIMPTLIRKAVAGEKIQTFTKNSQGEYVPETESVAKEGQYVFQNINDSKDTFIPQDANIINEYDVGNNVVGNNFMPFIRKSKPSRLLVGIIKKPTMIIVKSRGNAEQYLDEGATLKLEESGDKKEVTGINAGGFEAWSITDKEGDIQKKNRANEYKSLNIPDIAQLFEKPNMTEKDKEYMKKAIDLILSTGTKDIKGAIDNLNDNVSYGIQRGIEYIQIGSFQKRPKEDIKANPDGKNIFQHGDITYFKDTFDISTNQFYGTVEDQFNLLSKQGFYIPNESDYTLSVRELGYMGGENIDVFRILLNLSETGRCDNDGNLIQDGTSCRRICNYDSLGRDKGNELADLQFVGDKDTLSYKRRYGAYPIRAIFKGY